MGRWADGYSRWVDEMPGRWVDRLLMWLYRINACTLILECYKTCGGAMDDVRVTRCVHVCLYRRSTHAVNMSEVGTKINKASMFAK